MVFVFFVTFLCSSDCHDFCTRGAFQHAESNGAKGRKCQLCNFFGSRMEVFNFCCLKSCYPECIELFVKSNHLADSFYGCRVVTLKCLLLVNRSVVIDQRAVQCNTAVYTSSEWSSVCCTNYWCHQVHVAAGKIHRRFVLRYLCYCFDIPGC